MTKFEKQNSQRLNIFMSENVTVDFFVGENELNSLYNSARKWRYCPITQA